MAETPPKARKGYVRCEVLMPALRYQLEPHPDDPSVFVLALLTPEGPVTLTLHRDAASQLGSALLVQSQRPEAPQPGPSGG